MLDMVL